MAIAATLRKFLADKRIQYDVVEHPHAETTYGSARSAHVSADRVAKAVLLKADDGYLLAVLPASRKLDLPFLRSQVERDLALAQESELPALFPDCAPGAIPAVGPAYGLDTLVEKCLRAQPELYFEAGDHEELIHVGEPDFEVLLGDAEYRSFSQFTDEAYDRSRLY